MKRVREAVDALNRGDVEAALTGAHPDLEWETLDVFPDAATYRGAERVREFFETWQESFHGFHLKLEKCVPAGEHHVVAGLRVGGEGVESGAAVESPLFFQVLEYRDGLLVRSRMYQTEAEALEAAGLEEG